MPGRYPALSSVEVGLSSLPLKAGEQLPDLIVVIMSIFLPFIVKKYFFRGNNIIIEVEFYLLASFIYEISYKIKDFIFQKINITKR